jgi:hypothetical protein
MKRKSTHNPTIAKTDAKATLFAQKRSPRSPTYSCEAFSAELMFSHPSGSNFPSFQFDRWPISSSFGGPGTLFRLLEPFIRPELTAPSKSSSSSSSASRACKRGSGLDALHRNVLAHEWPRWRKATKMICLQLCGGIFHLRAPCLSMQRAFMVMHPGCTVHTHAKQHSRSFLRRRQTDYLFKLFSTNMYASQVVEFCFIVLSWTMHSNCNTLPLLLLT